jgi:transposase
VQLVVDQGYSVRKAADAMGLGVSTMDKWARQLRDERGGKGPASGTAITDEQREIQALKKCVRELEEEKTVLKRLPLS